MRPLSSRLQDPYGWTLSKSAGSDPRTKLGPRRYQQTSPRSHYYLPRQLQTNNSFIGSVGPNLTKITPRSPIHPQRIPQKYHTKYHTIVPQVDRPHGKYWSVPTRFCVETPTEKTYSSPLYYTSIPQRRFKVNRYI